MLQRGFTPEAISKALIPKKEQPAPSPPPARSPWISWETGLGLLKFGTQVGWAFYQRQQYWVEQERRVLAAARDHQGWLTEAQFLAALSFKSREAATVRERLCKQGLCRVVVGRQGCNVYLFESFMPPILHCEYCDQARPQGRCISCPSCGAP